MNNGGFFTGLGFGAGVIAATLLTPIIPLLVIGGAIYLANKLFPEENNECEIGQQKK